MPTTSAGPASAAVTGTITVLHAAALLDGVSPALVAEPARSLPTTTQLPPKSPSGSTQRCSGSCAR